MHVKFATLRDKHALEAWICDSEPLHGSNQVCMEKGLNGIGESQAWLGKSYEDSHGLGELDEQLCESDEDFLRLDEFFIQLGESDEFSREKVVFEWNSFIPS